MSDEYPTDPLGLELGQLRALGHQLVDIVADHWATLDAGPALQAAAPEQLAALGGPVPQDPSDPAAALRRLADEALVNMQNAAHPRFFARVPSPASYTGILGEWLGTGFNAIAASWTGGSGPTAVELTVIDWLAQLLGFPAETEGVLVSGGSIGNLTALLAARAAGYDGPVYLSDQTHSSIGRGLRALGYDEAAIRVVAARDRFAWRFDDVAAAIAADDDAAPAIVIATAGTTNTGAVDPLPALADLCAQRGLWLHVDGAYGAPAAMAPSGAAALAGMERADSLTIDPHKWLFAPFDVGCVLVRRPGALEHAFSMNPEYLADVQGHAEGEIDLRNRGLELSRRTRATKLWLTLTTHGAKAIAAAIETSLQLAVSVQRVLESDPYWEVVTPAQLAVVTFAAAGLSDAEHEARARAVTDSGFAAVSCTILAGRTVYRLCLINPRTTLDDVTQTLARLRAPAVD